MDMVSLSVQPASLAPRQPPRMAGLEWLSRPARDAVALMLALGRQEGQTLAIVLSAQARVPNTRFERIMRRLVRAGLVCARRGRFGGYTLGRDAAQITLLDIISVAGELGADDDLGLAGVGRELRAWFGRRTLADVLLPHRS